MGGCGYVIKTVQRSAPSKWELCMQARLNAWTQIKCSERAEIVRKQDSWVLGNKGTLSHGPDVHKQKHCCHCTESWDTEKICINIREYEAAVTIQKLQRGRWGRRKAAQRALEQAEIDEQALAEEEKRLLRANQL